MLNITLQTGTTVRDNDFQNVVSKMESKWEFRRRRMVKISIWSTNFANLSSHSITQHCKSKWLTPGLIVSLQRFDYLCAVSFFFVLWPPTPNHKTDLVLVHHVDHDPQSSNLALTDNTRANIIRGKSITLSS